METKNLTESEKKVLTIAFEIVEKAKKRNDVTIHDFLENNEYKLTAYEGSKLLALLDYYAFEAKNLIMNINSEISDLTPYELYHELCKKIEQQKEIEKNIDEIQDLFSSAITKLEDAGCGMFNAPIVIDGKDCLLQCYPNNEYRGVWLIGYDLEYDNINELSLDKQKEIIDIFKKEYINKKTKDEIINKLNNLTCSDFTKFMQHIGKFRKHDYVSECSSSEIGKMICYANSEIASGVDVKLEILSMHDYYIYGRYNEKTKTYHINGLLDDYDEWKNWFNYECFVDKLTDEQIDYLFELE